MKRSLTWIMTILMCLGLMLGGNAIAAETDGQTGALEGYIYKHANVWTADSSDGWPRYNLSSYTPAEEEFVGANGVNVKLDGPQSVVTTTDNNGYFKFTGLTPGSYSLTTESVNYENLVINGIEIEAGKTFNIVSEAGSYVPLGSTFYLLAGIDRDDVTYYAENTVNDLTTLLYNKNKLAKECISLSGSQVKKTDMKQYIEKLGQNLTFSDTLVIYYYGSSFLNSADGKVYLDCADAKFNGKNPVYSTLISSGELLSWLNDNMVNNNSVVLIIEADNSSQFVMDVVTGFKGPIAAIAAADDNGEWYELENTKHGLMSEGIIGSLTQVNTSADTLYADISKDGMVTVPEIFLTMENFVDNIPDIEQNVKVYLNNLFRQGVNFYR